MKLIDKIKSAGSSLILLTPPPFDPAAIPQKVQPENAKEYSYKAPIIIITVFFRITVNG